MKTNTATENRNVSPGAATGSVDERNRDEVLSTYARDFTAFRAEDFNAIDRPVQSTLASREGDPPNYTGGNHEHQ
jgi:hypothetical protein